MCQKVADWEGQGDLEATYKKGLRLHTCNVTWGSLTQQQQQRLAAHSHIQSRPLTTQRLGRGEEEEEEENTQNSNDFDS